jgi:2-methylisocitrate lyase-like PEP mutase family enzyme
VISAKLYEQAGFPALGTTSAGIAASLGYPDGQRMSLQDNLQVVRRIACRLGIPLTADIESGYATTVEGVVAAAASAWNAGAVGINLEDSTGDPGQPLFSIAEQVEKIRAIRKMMSSLSFQLFLNLRTDAFLLPGGDSASKFKAAVSRGNAYREAGADCIFVPDSGELNKETIAKLVKEINAPLNVIAGAHLPPVPVLQEIGVARVSLGPRAMRAMLALLKKTAAELLLQGTYTSMTAETLSYAEVNSLLEMTGIEGQ